MHEIHTAVPRPTDDFFRSLEMKRTRALVERNSKVLEELHAPDYQLVTPAGKVFSRERYLSAVMAAPFYSGWEVGDMSVRASPCMTVVRYRAALRLSSGREVLCWHTDTYELTAGIWQAVWSQATEILAPADRSGPSLSVSGQQVIGYSPAAYDALLF